ncbi:cation transporter [Litoribacter ruber]|uniref:Cation transporter n=1 Tax=Litoribacter ruber TaxID=702568 RepID=A0AAP2CJK4_9BACT|nr:MULTISPECIES: cation diffusion facilitator family transporter [Litoribacter]MBS9525100.1 cation transporter [Litoribacter alkaliphilus]MBT0811797.1 cation transporter [Litoribacter ruber]
MYSERKKWIVLSVIVSVVLLMVKFYAYYITNSTAILTDALESIVNVIASGFAFYSIYLSAQPKDENHPYGHGKIEFFSAGIEGTLIMLAGVFIIYRAIYGLFVIEPLEHLPTGMFLVGISGLINGLLGLVLYKKGKALHSLTLEADGRHLQTDAVSSLVLLVGVGVIYWTGLYMLDSVFSLFFAGYILYNGYLLVRKSVAGLMDETNPIAMADAVKVLNLSRKNNWIDIHNMRVQQYGPDKHIDLHLTLPYYYDLKKVHDEVEEVEDVLKENLPGYIEVFVHVDPCVPFKCCHYCQITDCKVREYEMIKRVRWNAVNMAKNQKHYHDLTKR